MVIAVAPHYILDRVKIQFNQNSVDLKPLGAIMEKLLAFE
jgi:hypothetical protein